MTANKINTILAAHAKWLVDPATGSKADLHGTDLHGADLHEADLRRADLNRADLHKADLSEADLHGTDLREANLQEADLSWADLYRANLRRADLNRADLHKADLYRANLHRADLSEADLRGANLQEADLSWADLYRANLRRANLHGACLVKTCLDPDNVPSGADDSFKRVRGYVIGYRTRKAGHIDKYRDGQHYSADVFSTSDTECHPGLYLWPTLELAKKWSPGQELIKVRTKQTEIHKAGTKWRCRWFEVIGEAKCKP